MPIVLDGSQGISTPMYGGAISSNAVTPVVGMKNKIINGACVIDQRNAGASITPTNGQYCVDRWQNAVNVSSKYSCQQVTDAPVGFNYSLKATSLSAYTIGAGEIAGFRQYIEGYNIADLGQGTANAKGFTLSFWVKSSLTGTFGGVVSNDNDRTWAFTYTISAANTWEQKSISITGQTGGTWLTTNGIGLSVIFSLAAGSSFLTTPAQWNSNNSYGATGQGSVLSTNGATWYITGVQLEVGSTATSFDYRPYGTELALCQRYYYKIAEGGSAYTQFGAGRAFSGTEGNGIVPFPVPMRSAPTFAYLGAVGDYDFSPTAITGGAVPASNTHMTVGMTFSSITSGSMFWLGANAGASGPAGFTFSAEL
jgi:hypothetical protein